MSTSVIGSQLDVIRAGLVAVSGLTGVNVFSGPVSYEEAGTECIAFGSATLSEAVYTAGGGRVETWDVEGEIRVVKPWAGGTELTIEAARDRLAVIFGLMETYLNDTYTGEVPDVSISSGRMVQDYVPEGRLCSLELTFTITAAKNP
jgi:hypothetical protein